MCVELTPSAADEIKSIVRQQDLGQGWLRIGVDGYGARRSFTLDLSDHLEDDEVVVQSQGISVVFARDAQPRLNGVTVDFLEVAGRRGFVFNTPTIQKGTAPGQGDPSAPLPQVQEIRQVLRQVIDPEVGVNIVDLGLVYDIVLDQQQVHVRMTMTTPACPLSEHITNEVTTFLTQAYPAVQGVEVEIVWEPRWSPEKISPEARQQLGWSR